MTELQLKKLKIISSVLFAGAIVLFGGCTDTSENKVVLEQIERLGPVELVETYYKSLQAKDFAISRACLAKEYAKEQETYSDSDEKNLKRLTNLKVKQGLDARTDIQQGKKYFKEVQVVAEYGAEYYKVTTSNDGKQVRFIYVVKKTQKSPWKIISIGSGP